jgi:hypothetical protein
MIIALYTLRTEKNKAILQKIAQEKTKHDEEKWVAQAAQSCLEAWYFDANGNPTLPLYRTNSTDKGSEKQ